MNNMGASISSLQQLQPQTEATKTKASPAEVQSAFADSLKNAINNVNKASVTSNQMTEKLAKGDVDNLHEVMVTAQKSSVTLQTAVQVQGKVIDAYKEISRMQV
ncbi:flagellar hook-basal body complex protein FliE [Pontibacillus yanchengensis]